MRRFDALRITVFVAGLAAGLLAGGTANAEFTFGTPTNLGPPVNSEFDEQNASISADGLGLYFQSNRPGSRDRDIWVCTRASVSDPWGEPENLGGTVNSAAGDCDPEISVDGLSLYFVSNRPGGVGWYDIWVTTRETTSGAWGQPRNLGPPINTSQYDAHTGLSADGLSLYFQSDRPGSAYHDIWVSTRASLSDPWGEPVNPDVPFNSPDADAHPSMSIDGQVLYFSSDRPGGSGSDDLWIMTRVTPSDPWSPPVNLGPAVNSADRDWSPDVPADGATLYFSSTRLEGSGGWDLWQVAIEPVADVDDSGAVDLGDFARLAQYWMQDELSVDISPPPLGDHRIDFRDLAVLTEHWLEEDEPAVYIQWLGHSTVKIWTEDCVVYVDPERVPESLHDATLVCVTHTHGDHYSPSDIARVSNAQTLFIAPPDVVQQYGSGQTIAPGQTIDFDLVSVTAVPAYNTNKSNHPQSRNWVGFIVQLAGKRIYVAGDTDLIPEMATLEDIDVAFLPAGGTYTMNATEAAEATQHIKPQLAIPYHWGQSVGTLSDAQTFVALAACNATVMTAGETLSSEDWQKDFSLVAHWKLDEEAGAVAHDSAGGHDGTLSGDPIWQPTGGRLDGALQLDGVDDCVSTPFVLNPADGPFSVFAWIRGGAPGQVILSQKNGANWLLVDVSSGCLGTELKGSGRNSRPLWSQAAITDDDWHRAGLTWDGSNRMLYVDDVEVASDTQSGLASSDGGLYFGAGKDLDPGTFFSGLIDDIRIYNRAVLP